MHGYASQLCRRIQGLALTAILLAVVLMTAIAVVIALSSRSTSTNTSTQTNDMLATTIINQASNLARGFDVMVANNIPRDDICFQNPANCTFPNAISLWDPARGGTEEQIPPHAAMQTTVPGDQFWDYNANLYLPGIGSNGGVDTVVVLGYLYQGVCQQINKNLHNSATIPVITSTSSATLANLTGGGGDGLQSPAINLTADSGFTVSWPEGCLKTYDGSYVYYRVVHES